MGLGAPAKPFRPSPRNFQLGVVSNRTICRARHVVRLRIRRSLSESGRTASLKRGPAPLLSGSPGLATRLAVADDCLPGSAFKPGSRGATGFFRCLVVLEVSPDHYGVLDHLELHSGIRQSFILRSHENTWAALTSRTGGFPTCCTRSADCDAAAVNKQEVASCHPPVWVRKQAKFESIAWTSISSNGTRCEREQINRAAVRERSGSKLRQ